jgi:hypothetical protein
MTMNKTLKIIYVLYVFGEFKLFKKKLAMRAIPFHKKC